MGIKPPLINVFSWIFIEEWFQIVNGGQEKTEKRLEELAQCQAKTKKTLKELAEPQNWYLPALFKRDFGISVGALSTSPM